MPPLLLFGLCFLRVSTWTLFRLKFYMNGHNLLAHKLRKKEPPTTCTITPSLTFQIPELPKNYLTGAIWKTSIKSWMFFAKRYCPVSETLGLGHTWKVRQIECATDIMLKQARNLDRFTMRSSGPQSLW